MELSASCLQQKEHQYSLAAGREALHKATVFAVQRMCRLMNLETVAQPDSMVQPSHLPPLVRPPTEGKNRPWYDPCCFCIAAPMTRWEQLMNHIGCLHGLETHFSKYIFKQLLSSCLGFKQLALHGINGLILTLVTEILKLELRGKKELGSY